MTTEFEVVSYNPPPRFKNSKYNGLHLELMQTLLKVPPGKSVRRAHSSASEAKSYYQSLNNFFKKQKVNGTYFAATSDYAEADGKFYVYIGRREGE